MEIVHRPDHEVTVALMHRALLQDHDLLPELLAAPELMPEWRAFVLERAYVAIVEEVAVAARLGLDRGGSPRR